MFQAYVTVSPLIIVCSLCCSGSPAGTYQWHQGAITSIEWHPRDPSVLAASAADDQVSIWDLSLERDEEAEREMGATGDDVRDYPPQMLFLHQVCKCCGRFCNPVMQGQRDIKEVHWHPQIPGALVSTALDGFTVFKPENVS